MVPVSYIFYSERLSFSIIYNFKDEKTEIMKKFFLKYGTGTVQYIRGKYKPRAEIVPYRNNNIPVPGKCRPGSGQTSSGSATVPVFFDYLAWLTRSSLFSF
jgi:hypothetical protein